MKAGVANRKKPLSLFEIITDHLTQIPYKSPIIFCRLLDIGVWEKVYYITKKMPF